MRMSLFKVGNRDFAGDTIQHVFAIGDEYVVYGTDNPNLSDSIKVRCDSILECDITTSSRYSGVNLLYGQAKGLLHKVKNDVTYKSRIAIIVAHALVLGNLRETNSYLKDIILEIYADSQERYLNSLKYLVTVILLVLSLVFLSVYTYTHPYYFKHLPLMRSLIYVSTAGAIGGMISVSLRLRRTTFEKEIPPYAYALFAVERVIIAILASYIVFLAIKNGLSFGPIAHNNFGYSLYGVLAGFSETFIPGFLSKLDVEKLEGK
jgi:hypothetical protein